MSTKTTTSPKRRIDFRSVRAISVVYFVVFAAFLIALIWVLQNFFTTNYYEQMKVQETQRTAKLLVDEYSRDPSGFGRLAQSASSTSDIFIRVDTGNGTEVYDSGSYFKPSNIAYDFETSTAKNQLESNSVDSVSLIAKDKKNDTRRLVYATYLDGRSSGSMLYIVAPLYPVQSTIVILQRQLKYISLIALCISFVLAMVIATRLSQPIKDITKSAIELSKGNYNVKFKGGMFTETKELAKTLNTASYEMQKTDSYQRDLIANVSHDLKTPLTMIKSYAEMINDISGDNPEKRRQHLNVIITETDRLNKLVTDMLSASRLQSNTLELHKETFDLVGVAEDIANTYLLLNEQEGYHVHFNKCKPTYVYGDKEKIKQVISNFASNAFKYGGDSKYMEISVKRSGKNVRVDVIDHGDGIAADELSHVWDRYYRTSANRTRDIEGSGLGLAICKGILVLHNADYGVDSKVGEGSDFWFEMETVRPPKV